MTGRKPRTAEQKLATGNPGRRPIQETGPLPDTGPVAMPAYLEKHEAAATLWAEYSPALLLLGTLRKESERMFAMWCMETALYEANPAEYNAARITQIRTMASSLGMDPSARGRFVTPTAKDDNPEEEYFRPRIVD